jgi:hypothetical protein
MKAMTQFQAHIPHPLTDHLPELLSPSRMGTPAIGILLLIFVRKHRLEASPVQVERYHVSGSKGTWGQSGKKEFVDHSVTQDTDGSGSGLMSGNDDSAPRPDWGEKHIRAVKKAATGAAFGMRDLLVRWQGQTSLDCGQIEQRVISPARHPG